MTLLQVMAEDDPGRVRCAPDHDRIAEALRASLGGVRPPALRGTITPDTTTEDVLSLYRAEIDDLCARQGLHLVDVARLHPQASPDMEEGAAKARSTFLEEHRHAEDEVRFFAHGTVAFSLHLDGRVHAVVCEAGDLLSVPAGTRHWFDMGPRPEFVAIRFSEKE